MSAFSLLIDALSVLSSEQTVSTRKTCRMDFGRVPRLDVERESRGVICSEYVTAKSAHEAEPTEETAKAFYDAKAALLSRLRNTRGNRIDANGLRFTLHEDGGISVHSRFRKFRDRVPALIRSFPAA